MIAFGAACRLVAHVCAELGEIESGLEWLDEELALRVRLPASSPPPPPPPPRFFSTDGGTVTGMEPSSHPSCRPARRPQVLVVWSDALQLPALIFSPCLAADYTSSGISDGGKGDEERQGAISRRPPPVVLRMEHPATGESYLGLSACGLAALTIPTCHPTLTASEAGGPGETRWEDHENRDGRIALVRQILLLLSAARAELPVLKSALSQELLAHLSLRLTTL